MVKKITVAPWDVTDFLTTEEHIAAYLREAMADGDPELLAVAIADAERARARNARDRTGSPVDSKL